MRTVLEDFGEVFDETAAIHRGAADFIRAAGEVAKTLYGGVERAMRPGYTRLQLEGSPPSQTLSRNMAGPGPGGGVSFNPWDEEEEDRQQRAFGLEW